MALTALLNILHVAIVERGEVRPGFSVGTEEFMEPGWRARVSRCPILLMSASSTTLPRSLLLPSGDHRECSRMRCKFADAREGMGDGIKHRGIMAAGRT